jgi:hypothetical protein
MVAAMVGVVVATGAVVPATAAVGSWTQVGAGSLNNVSGIAATASGWLMIRDNKKAGQDRIALLDDTGHVTSLVWPGSQPTDLEAVDQLPGTPGGYAAVSSAGRGALLTISGTTVTVSGSFVLPNATSGVEAFALTQIGTSTVAVWATRGSTTAPAKVSAATFTASTGAFGKVSTGKVTVPYPTASVRPVTDLKVVGSRLVISSASDPGANGPFTSAVYDVGAVSLTGGRAALHLASPESLGQFSGHKIEAIACSGSTGILGSDDEKSGGWVMPFPFCGA